MTGSSVSTAGVGTEELEVYREHESGPIRHAKIRLGDTIVEMGEAHGQYWPMPTGYITTCRMWTPPVSERSAPAPN